MLNRFKKILIVMASVLLISMLITGFLLLGSCSSQSANSDITVTKMPDVNIDSADKTVESDNPDEIIVVYSKPSVKTLTVFKNTDEIAESIDAKADNTNSSNKEFSLYISKIKTVSNRVDVITPAKNADTSELIKILNGDPNVLCAGKNFTRKLCVSPNNSYYSDQWWFTSVGADKTWDKVNNENPVVVAVIDSGLDMTHENIRERYVSGYDYITNSSNIIDLRGHGTMVSGCIASTANNSKGIVGIAGTANVKIAPYRTGGMSASDDDLDGACIVAAIYDAADRPEIKVINMSFCGYYDDPYIFARPSSDEVFNDYPEYQAIKYAASKGKVLVAAAGNEGSNPNLQGAYSYPASYSDVISVAATTSNDMRVSFSQYNDEIELSAPGQGIVTLSLKSTGASEYTYGNGTSFSSSIVAGLAAVLFADNPDLTAEDVRFILNNTAQDIGNNKSYFGSGKVRIDLALAESRKDSTITNTETSSAKTVLVTGIGINPKSISLSAGQTRKLAVTIKPSNAANKNYIFWSDNEKVATVDKSGLVKAVGNGTAKIYAAAGDSVNTDMKVSCTVTVSAKSTASSGSKVAVSSIGINSKSISLSAGQTKKLTITIKPSNAANKNYILWSDNKEVATVDKTGLVTAVGVGKTTIHATTEDGSKSATCTVTVVKSNPPAPAPATPPPATPTPTIPAPDVPVASIPVTGIRLSLSNVSLNAGQTKQLEATIQPSNAENKAVYYWSDNPGIATVDQTGLVTAVSGGPNNTDTANIYVVAEDGRYSLDPKTAACTVMVFMLSDSKQETKGSIDEKTNILKVDSVIDFKVRQGIAIENLEQVSYNEDGSRRYTWFVAKILDINAEKNEIKINRPAPFSISNVTVKHDNTFIFSDQSSHGAYGGGGIAEYISSTGGNKNIVFPKGVYEINAVWVDWFNSSQNYIASGDVPSNAKAFDYDNTQFGWFGLSGSACLPLSGVENVTLDFSNSKIKLNGDIHMNHDYDMNDGYGTGISRTRPMEFLNITNSNNITIKNLDIDGGGMQTTRSSNVIENRSYAIEMRGAVDCKITNVKASHFVTDAVLVAKSGGTNGRTSEDITIDNLVADRNARQGMSVCNVNGITIKNSKFMNSGYLNKFGGHAPNDGIDFELEIPDSKLTGNYLCNITVDNVVFYNNKGSSFKFYQFHNTIPKDTDPPEYTPKMDNIKFSNIFSYQPNGVYDFHFGGSCVNLGDVTITNSIFINKPVQAAGGSVKVPVTDINYELNFDLKFENCSFLGAFFWDMHRPKLQLKDCNFLLDRYSRFMFENDLSSPYNYFDIKDSFLYFTEQAVEDTRALGHPIFNFAGLNFDGSTIYNGHTDTIVLNFFTDSFYSGLKDTKILGNGGLRVNLGDSNIDLRNQKVTTSIIGPKNAQITSSKDLSADEDNNGEADEAEQAKAKYNELRNAIIKRIKDNGFESYN